MAGKAECYYRYAFACRECHTSGSWHFGGSSKSFEDARRDARGRNTATCPKKHPLPERFRPFDEEYKVSVLKCPHCGGEHLAGHVSHTSEASAMSSLESMLEKCKDTTKAH